MNGCDRCESHRAGGASFCPMCGYPLVEHDLSEDLSAVLRMIRADSQRSLIGHGRSVLVGQVDVLRRATKSPEATRLINQVKAIDDAGGRPLQIGIDVMLRLLRGEKK